MLKNVFTNFPAKKSISSEQTMKKSLLATVLALALGVICSPAHAEFPDRPVTLVVPFSAGGATDLDARAFAEVAGKYLGQPVTVNNHPGNSGTFGSQFVSMSAPDGYTILIGRPGPQGVATSCFAERTPYTLDSFTFLGMIDTSPCVLMLRPDAPYRNLAQLVADIKANPGKLKYSSSGVNSIHNFATQYMLKITNLKPESLVHVRHRGGGEALEAIKNGQVDMMFSVFTEAAPYIKEGSLKPLLVMTRDPCPFAPEIPTATDAGLAKYEFGTWFVLLGPADMPQDVRDKYWDVIQKVVADEEYQQKIAEIGCTPLLMDGAVAKEFVINQNTIYRNIGKAIGLVK